MTPLHTALLRLLGDWEAGRTMSYAEYKKEIPWGVKVSLQLSGFLNINVIPGRVSLSLAGLKAARAVERGEG